MNHMMIFHCLIQLFFIYISGIWDGSEKKYSFDAFEKKEGREIKLGMVEVLPSAYHDGTRTFAVVFESVNKEEKILVVTFKKLKDSLDIAKKEMSHRPNEKCKEMTLKVTLLGRKKFFKKIMDMRGDSPIEKLNKKVSTTKNCNNWTWDVHADKDINGLKSWERYFIEWM